MALLDSLEYNWSYSQAGPKQKDETKMFLMDDGRPDLPGSRAYYGYVSPLCWIPRPRMAGLIRTMCQVL